MGISGHPGGGKENMDRLADKVALITGAGSGIGRATATLFAREGAEIMVADFVPQSGHETVRLIQEAGGQAAFVEADVSKSSDAQKMITSTVDTFGRLDILFNNAGIQGKFTMTADLAEEVWDRVFATNVKGVFLGSKYAIPVMLKQGGGVIISTASVSGMMGLPGVAAYGASKAGVIQLTKTMALEYADRNIRVNCICPGTIMTGITAAAYDPDNPPPFKQSQAMRRYGQAEEVAKVALYLASDDSSFVTGTCAVVDGGYTAGVPKVKPKRQ
jgi:NAD(P)-dependent dehydrogenase (short-subunit alcohol dehydrogenase family)